MTEKNEYSELMHTLAESLKEVVGVREAIEQQEISEIRLQNQLDEYWISINKYTVDPSGIQDSYGALMSALTASTDTIYIPKGVYLIGQNIVIPANKKLIFGRNARLKPATGVTLSINGTWDASDDDWIFDMSLGGIINGDFKVDEIHPEWTGAKADGVIDDAKAFNDAMTLCARKRILRLGAKTYKVKSTIENNSRGIKGVMAYIDGSNSGTLISFDPTDKTTDLLPCIRITQGGASAVFENFKIAGTVSYSSRYLSNWIDKVKFEAGTYDMFAVGTVAIEVAGASTPVFRNVATSNIKVGLLLNSTNGHITTYDSKWSGLIGVYCRRNSEDYYFHGGSISGAFCGFMLGIINTSNHYGGAALRMTRVHMGFSPYGFYQVKDTNDYDSIANCGGIYGAFETVRFEQIGEACIKLLPKSLSSGYYSGMGFGWSPIDYTGDSGRWQYSLPDDLMAQADKQKYAVYFGKINKKLIIDNWDGGDVKKSSASGAIGTAFIDHIATDDIMLDGLGDPNLITIRRKRESASITLTTPKAVEDVIHARAYNPISHGQLVKNPEVISNWTVTNGGTLSIITDLTQLPIGLSSEAISYLGENVKILKITPDGINSPNISLPFLPPTIADIGREIGYEYFMMSENAVAIRSNMNFTAFARLYDQTYNITALKWARVRNRGLKPSNITFINIAMGNLNKTRPTYIVGLMVSYDHNGAYSPYPHSYTNTDFEIGDKSGLILTDTTDGSRSRITLTNGYLQSENMNGKTKVYSPNGIPYKISVADDGTLSTSLDALFYDSFDVDDNTTLISSASTLGSAWVAVKGTWNRSSNEAYSITLLGTSIAVLSNGVGTTNYNVGCAMKGQLLSSSDYSRPGIMVKYIDGNNHFWIEFTNNALHISRRVSGMGTTVSSVSFTPIDNVYYKMRVVIKDNVISGYVNGDLKLSYKLTPIDITTFGLSEIVGLRHHGSGTISTPAKFNNFVVEQI
jgi:hypothetical protein